MLLSDLVWDDDEVMQERQWDLSELDHLHRGRESHVHKEDVQHAATVQVSNLKETLKHHLSDIQKQNIMANKTRGSILRSQVTCGVTAGLQHITSETTDAPWRVFIEISGNSQGYLG